MKRISKPVRTVFYDNGLINKKNLYYKNDPDHLLYYILKCFSMSII